MDWNWTLIFLLLRASLAIAAGALSVTPSTNWYGYDGSWSAVSIRVGSSPQWLDVEVSTRSAETWVIGTDGCQNNNALCTRNRGHVFNTTSSTTFQTLGFYDLGINAELGETGYGYYGLDSLTLGSTGVTVESSPIAVINATEDNWLGSLGLSIIPGSFNNSSPLSIISALVEEQGEIESHSYGYTAGARYRQKGVPVSLTLGGYDANRFVPHNLTFNLNLNQQPQVFISSITLHSTTGNATQNNWTDSNPLLSASDSVSAIIDSSTPYLWFPKSVCDRFATILGLSYNDTLNLYTFDNNSDQRTRLQESDLMFTFSLLDLSSSTEAMNISVMYDAFDLELTFPAIPNTTYGTDESSKFYFPLRQATNEAQYRIGRSFLQEAYIITDYERNTFSVHQAVHTSDPITNINIVTISRSNTTTLSGPSTRSNKKLSPGAIAGIAVGSVAAIVIFALIIFCLCRRNRGASGSSVDEEKPLNHQHRTLLDRILRRRESHSVQETNGSSSQPTEVGADASHERFELPAPLGPVELDSASGTLGGSTENDSSTQDSANMSAYDRARRKIEQQRAATRASHPEKTENDVSQVAHYRPESDQDSPLVSSVGAGSGSFSTGGQPSPMTPSLSPHESTSPPNYRRIDPANVMYAGRLPSNVQLPSNVPKVMGRDGRTIPSEGSSEPSASDPTDPGASSSLGSQFTVNQSRTEDLYGGGSDNAHADVSPISNATGSGGNGFPQVNRRRNSDETFLRDLLDPMGSRRRLDGEDLVHVPQPAEQRFSFEEERISGNERLGS